MLMKLEDTIKTYSDWIYGMKSAGSAKIYLFIVNKFIDYTGKDRDIASLEIKDFLSFKAQLLKEGKSGSSYVSLNMSALSGYVRFLKIFHKNIRLQVDALDIRDLRQKIIRKLPGSLERWQIDALIEACDNVMERAMLGMLFHAGLRANELAKLRTDDIIIRDRHTAFQPDISDSPEGPDSPNRPDRESWLKIHGKGGKERLVPLNLAAQRELEAYMAARSHVLGNIKAARKEIFPITPGGLWQKVREIGKRAGIIVHPHLLRHSFATELLNSGADIRVIADLMGHESLDTTKIYTRVKPVLASETVNRLNG